MNERLRIAIADDDSVTREFLLRVLLRMGHEVVCVAEDGRELADGCLGVPLDVVITDVKMPRLDGIAAAAEIAWQREVAVLLLSASDLPQRPTELHHVPHLMRMVKPISSRDLEAAIAVVRPVSATAGAA
jgi:response regulator NasT